MTRADLQNLTGKGVRIAVLDSGIDTTHPALDGLRLADDIAFERDGPFLKAVDTSGDVIGHGTAIAWIIRSMAPDAEIGSFRVLDADLRGRTTIIWEAARLAVQRGYHILNCSFGSPGEARFVMPYKEWTDEAYLRRAHIVAACSNEDANQREWPGWFPTVLTVNLADMPPEVWSHRPGSMVEFLAHGLNVKVPWQGGWKVVTGSSFAAPRVTAWLARLLEARPGISVETAKEMMRGMAVR
jgi:subtilisin family serine protease